MCHGANGKHCCLDLNTEVVIKVDFCQRAAEEHEEHTHSHTPLSTLHPFRVLRVQWTWCMPHTPVHSKMAGFLCLVVPMKLNLGTMTRTTGRSPPIQLPQRKGRTCIHAAVNSWLALWVREEWRGFTSLLVPTHLLPPSNAHPEPCNHCPIVSNVMDSAAFQRGKGGA